MLYEKEMTMEELQELEEIKRQVGVLGARIIKIVGKHFINEEVMPLQRVHAALITANVGIGHFLHESKTASKWRHHK